MTITPTATPDFLTAGSLLGEQPGMLIDGQWLHTTSTRPVDNPSTGEIFTSVPEGTDQHVDDAIRAAHRAQRVWARLSYPERGVVLGKVIDVIEQHAEELARIIVTEQGKTIVEARGEVQGCKAFFDFAVSQKYRTVGEVVAPMSSSEQLIIRDEPYGVVGAIIPWNFPAAIFARKVAPALMAGNAIVLKPSEVTPLSPIAMARICQLAGVPDGLINLVTGPGREVGKTLTQHPLVHMVTVTGSTRAGVEILKQVADKVITVSLELGGKAPLIVFEDADLDHAAQLAFEARFWNCGQVCTCNERTYVHSSVHDRFVELLTEKIRGLQVGDPMDELTQMGPKVSSDEWDKVSQMVDQAVSQGATVAIGGGRPDGEEYAAGYWFAPTLLVNATNDMDIVQQEVFGPVLPVVSFETYDEVVEMANSTEFGLTSYVFTSNIDTAMRITDDLEFGEVYINKIGPEQPQGFHTGWKMSGLGGEDGTNGFQRYLRKKTVYLGYR